MLAESEQRLRLIAEYSSDLIFRHDPFGVCNYVSSSCRHILGYEPEELIGTVTRGLAHPDDLTEAEHAATAVPRSPSNSPVLTCRVRRKDGAYVWLESMFRTRLHPVTGEIVEVQTAARDVSVRKRAEEAVRLSEASFRALIECAPDILLVHARGRLAYANPAAVRTLGYENASQLVGTMVLDLIPNEDRPRMLAHIESLRGEMSRAQEPVEQRLLHRTGRQLVTALMQLQVMFNGELAIVVIAHDLTESREMQAQLALADRMVSVGTMAAGVAHEINNPLAFVIANLGFALEEVDQFSNAGENDAARFEDLRHAIAQSQEGTDRIRKVVRDLKTFSRGEDDRRGAVDLRRVLESSLNIAWNEIRHRAHLVKDHQEIPPVDGSESRLGQVFSIW